MRAEALRRRRWALLACAALFTTGCATLPAPPGPGDTHGAAEVLREEAGASAFWAQAPSSGSAAEKRPRVRLRRRHGPPVVGTDVAVVSPEQMAVRAAAGPEPSTQAVLSCGGLPVPEGWPDSTSWGEEELLAPFFQCASPGEFLALQRGVDMPRLVEALEDWSAVRLGALGPMEAPAAQVLQRKRFSFLVSAPQRFGAYSQVLTLFLFDTAFDDEVGELLVLLSKDKQLEQTLGKMEAVREALERRGFQLSDYPDREEQWEDVVRGLGRAAADVAATIPGADGASGTRVYGARAGLPPLYQQAFDETQRALMREHFSAGHVALGTFDSLTFGVPLGFYSLAAGTGQGVSSLYQGHYEQASRELAPAALMVGLYAGGKAVRSLSEAQGAAGLGEQGVRLQVPEPRLQVLKEVVERLRERLGEEGLGQLARLIQGRREAAVMVAAGGEPAALALYEARGDLAKAQAVLSQAKPELRGSTRPMAGAGKSPGGAASGDRPATIMADSHAPGAKVQAQDIKGARPYGPEGRPGHPDAHGVSRQDQADIMNDPKTTVYRGINANGRPIDHYHRDGTTVVTEQGEPTRVITAFGKLATKDNQGRPIQRGMGKPANPVPNGGPYEKLR